MKFNEFSAIRKFSKECRAFSINMCLWAHMKLAIQNMISHHAWLQVIFGGKNSLINDYWSSIVELGARLAGLLWLKQKVKSIYQNEPHVLPKGNYKTNTFRLQNQHFLFRVNRTTIGWDLTVVSDQSHQISIVAYTKALSFLYEHVIGSLVRPVQSTAF